MMFTENIIPNLTIFYMVITLIISLILPIAIWVILGFKVKGITPAIIAGALGFVVPQIVIRLNILQLLQLSPKYLEFAENNHFLFSFLLGFTAALFETVGRVVVFLYMKKHLSYNFGLGAGLGHGGIEAIYFVGLTYINNLIFSFMVNTQGISAVSESLGDEQLVQGSIDLIISTPAEHFIYAGIERLAVMIIHVAFSLIICYGFVANKLPICITTVMLLHTLLDTASVFMSFKGFDISAIVFAVVIFAAVMLIIVIKIRKHFPLSTIPKDEGQLAVEQGY